MLDRALAILPDDTGLRVIRASFLCMPQPTRNRCTRSSRRSWLESRYSSGVADEWLYLALCERDLPAAYQAIEAMGPQGYSNQGVVIPAGLV